MRKFTADFSASTIVFGEQKYKMWLEINVYILFCSMLFYLVTHLPGVTSNACSRTKLQFFSAASHKIIQSGFSAKP